MVKDIGSLSHEIHTVKASKRAVFSSTLELSEAVKFSVKGYLLYKSRQATKSSSVVRVTSLPTTTNQPDSDTAAVPEVSYEFVKSHTVIIGAETGTEYTPSVLQRAYKFGPKLLRFSNEQLLRIRNLGEPIIRLIGFVDASELIWALNLKPGYFLYPNDAKFRYSTRGFTALDASLRKKNKNAIVWWISRKGSAPRVCALIPAEPTGLQMVPLPYGDDIRSMPEPGVGCEKGELKKKKKF